MKWINRLYIFFLGIILSITTGFGIAAFYPEPVYPQYPTESFKQIIPTSCTETPQSAQSSECQQYYDEQERERQASEQKRQQYEKELKEYQNKNAGYTRTAIFLGITVGSLYAILGLSMIKRSKLLATGLLLAGVLTALLTRLLISLASFGSAVGSTEGANTLGYIEFFILLVLSGVIIFVGMTTLKDEETAKAA